MWNYQRYRKPHRGSVILVLGILGLVVCQLLGIAAWVMGNNDIQEMDQGLMDSSGRDLTNAGRICGMVATALLTIPMLFFLLVGLASVLSH
jgi:hypothetical protein